jgi:protein transport protein HofC
MALFNTPRRLAQFGEMYHQLAGMLTSGITLVQAAELLRDAPPSGAFRQHLCGVIADLKQGSSFAESVAARRGWMPAFDIALLDAGERSGRLDACCQRLSEYYQERARLVRSMMSDLAYPAFLVLLVVVVFPPSALTRLVTQGDVAGFVGPKLALFALFAAAEMVVLFLNHSGRSAGFRAGWEALLHAIPVFGRARRAMALARLSLALEALLNAGVDVLKSWELSAAASGSPALERATTQALRRMASGETPGEAIATTGVFPPKFLSVYRSGELSGRVDQSLQYLHKDFADESSRLFKRMAEWMPRLIFLLVAGLIGYYVVTFWTAYFGGMVDAIDAATQGQ